MATQTTYPAAPVASFPGMKANAESGNTISRIAETAIGFGVVVIQGTLDNQVKAAAAGTFDATVGATVGTGNGVLTLATPKTAAGVKPGVYNVVIIEPASNGGTFEVEDPDGVIVGTGVIGTPFDGVVKFTLADGSTDFVAGDRIPVTVTETGIPVFRGVSLIDKTLPPSQADAYAIGDVVAVLNEGVVWVLAGATVTVGQPAYFVPSTGAITNVAAGNIPIPNNAFFDSSAASGAIVKLRLN